MFLPSNLQAVLLSVTNSAIVNTATDVSVASPGPGFRYRLWSLQAATVSTAQAPGNWLVLVGNGAFGTWVATLAGQGFASPSLQVPGGLGLADDGAIRLRFTSSAASIAVDAVVLYSLEAT